MPKDIGKEINKEGGYVLAYRRAWRNPIFKDFLEAAVWNYLYQNACWEADTVRINDGIFDLERGQIAITMSFLAKGFRVTEKVMRSYIQKLQKHGMLVIRGTNQGTILTICNYSLYQDFEKAEVEAKGKRRENGGKTKGDNIKQTKQSNQLNEINRAVKKQPPPSNRGTSLSPDWKLGDAGNQILQYFVDKGYEKIEIQKLMIEQHDVFVDYWSAVSGAKGIKKDWNATFRNWIRNQIKYRENK